MSSTSNVAQDTLCMSTVAVCLGVSFGQSIFLVVWCMKVARNCRLEVSVDQGQERGHSLGGGLCPGKP